MISTGTLIFCKIYLWDNRSWVMPINIQIEICILVLLSRSNKWVQVGKCVQRRVVHLFTGKYKYINSVSELLRWSTRILVSADSQTIKDLSYTFVHVLTNYQVFSSNFWLEQHAVRHHEIWKLSIIHITPNNYPQLGNHAN